MECFRHRSLKPLIRFNPKELEIIYWSDFSLDLFLEKIDFYYIYSLFDVLKLFLNKNSYIFL
ncbi:hypothetical protein CIB43_00412 [Mesomycoplasma hyopneumoniae]|nr:hypothetical protein CIB43_00412 [Mesomycoplasma hyopneumoniae]